MDFERHKAEREKEERKAEREKEERLARARMEFDLKARGQQQESAFSTTTNLV